MGKVKQFLLEGRAAGCPREQLWNFAKAKIWLQPRQLQASAAARACDATDGPVSVAYGGARGGGKSHWLLAQIGADDCQRYAGLNCLLLRKVHKSNTESLEQLAPKVFRHVPHQYVHNDHVLSFGNGSQIRAKHFHHESEIESFLGLEYDVIGIEEATTLSWRKYLNIRTCLRTSRPNWRPRLYCATNPGGVGHAWFVREFIEPSRRKAEKETRFIQCKITDNPFLNAEYRNSFERMGGWQKRAWFHGDWDIAAGQFFHTFRRDAHVVNHFDDTRAVEWFASFDYGFKHYTAFLLGCKDGDGNYFIVDEHVERFILPSQHSVAIRQMLQRHLLYPEKLRWIVAGTDCFSTQYDGTTIAEEYRRNGLKLRPANTERINGWATMHRLLGDPDRGIAPRLFIHERCTRLIDCLPRLQHDPHRPEDVLKCDLDDETGEGGDDTADAARYLVHYKPVVSKQVRLRGL